MGDIITGSPSERETTFRGILAKEFPHLSRLVNRLDQCENGKDQITIDANFASELEEDIFKLVVQRELQQGKIMRLQKEIEEG